MITVPAFATDNPEPVNRAFLFGDAVKVFFFIRKGQLIMAEECYFFLMSSMRKMRMNIPLSYTLDFFQNLVAEQVLEQDFSDGAVLCMAYRNYGSDLLHKAQVSLYFKVHETDDMLQLKKDVELDLIKEINVNSNLLSNIRVHCPENIYAEIYARENGLDDVILLNPDKRIARSGCGNLLFMEGSTIKVPKQKEGAYISPLMENLVTFIHRNALAEILEAELIAFESQKAEEILLVSDEKGIFPVSKIRNKTFGKTRFTALVEQWQQSFL